MKSGIEVVKFITNHHKPPALYRQTAASIEKDKVPAGGCKLKKFCDTRFGSKVSIAQRYRNVLCLVLEKLLTNNDYNEWVGRRKADTRAKAAEIKRRIFDPEHRRGVDLTIKILVPFLILLRMTDSKTGAALGKVYGCMHEMDEWLNEPIASLDDKVRKT